VIDMSRKQFSMDRATVEKEVFDWHKDNGQAVTPKKEIAKTGPAVVTDSASSSPVPRSVSAPIPTVNPARAPMPNRVFEKPKYFKRDDVRPSRPVTPLPEITSDPDDDFVPLKEVKIKTVMPENNVASNNSNLSSKKEVNQKSLADLRAVLENLKKDKKVIPEPVKNDESVKKVEEIKPVVQEKTEIKEVPEDKLRKILDINN
jgi:hypothetical protein